MTLSPLIGPIRALAPRAAPRLRLALSCGLALVGVGLIGTLAEAEINGKHIRRLRHKTKVFAAW